jgi:hypothetical protein
LANGAHPPSHPPRSDGPALEVCLSRGRPEAGTGTPGSGRGGEDGFGGGDSSSGGAAAETGGPWFLEPGFCNDGVSVMAALCERLECGGREVRARRGWRGAALRCTPRWHPRL